jgi:hypothetical protein
VTGGTAQLAKERQARKVAEQTGESAKNKTRKIPKPAGCAGDNYSIIKEMGLADNKPMFKAIQVSGRHTVTDEHC